LQNQGYHLGDGIIGHLTTLQIRVLTALPTYVREKIEQFQREQEAIQPSISLEGKRVYSLEQLAAKLPKTSKKG